MSNDLARRPVGAVKALEQMQREERETAGPPLPQMDAAAVLSEALRRATPADASRWAGPDGDAAYRAFLASIRADLETGVSPEVRQRMQADAKRLRLHEGDQWSSFESPVMRWRIADTCSRIESAIRRYEHARRWDLKAAVIMDGDRSWTLSQPPAVGTLNTGQVMATSHRTKPGEMVILLDNGVFEFAHMLAQLGVMALHEAEAGGPFSEVTLLLVSDIVVSQTVIGTCLGTLERRTPPAFEVMVRALEDAIVTFVVAHEYAHLLNGDLDMHSLGDHSSGGDLRAREFAADVKGLRITLSAGATTQFKGAPMWGSALYFAGLDLLDRAEAAYHQRAFEPESRLGEYPKPFDRMVNLLGMLEHAQLASLFSDAIQVSGRAYNAVLFAFDVITPVLWSVSPKLREYEAYNLSDPERVELFRSMATSILWAQRTGQQLPLPNHCLYRITAFTESPRWRGQLPAR